VVEDVAGKSLAVLAQELVFDKLGMTNSTFESVLPERYMSQAATAHQVDGTPVPGKWHLYPEQAAASLWSTPSDLARLVVEVLKAYQDQSDLVLSPEMTRLMLTPHVGWVGLGFPVIEMDGWTWFDHGGWNEGFHSNISGYLGKGQGLVWMTNGENGKLLGFEVMRAIASVFGWPGFKQVEKSIARVDTAIYAQFEGIYYYVDEPEFGVEIIKDGDCLFSQETPKGNRHQLHPESQTDFFFLHSPQEVSFIIGDRGKVEAMMIGEYAYLERVA
jgi:hypothetical protein